VNDFVIKAAALALRAVPTVNASYTESAIRRYRPINIAVAVALGEGLVTPVIEDADLKSMAKISSSVKDFAAQARAGKLAPGSTRGGTFSVSNLGGYGVREFTAVINPPQAAILAVGVAEPRAVVQNGKLSIATMMTVTLSADHRVIDGAVAAEWLSAFRKFMENP
jgi:pyruvate dehydrogenase E2 component (dihydrolipoamide acetyltransferase)